MTTPIKYGQYLVDNNPNDRVFVLPTLPEDADEANRLYGSTFVNCVRKTDVDNMVQRWLMASTTNLKRGKKNRKLLTGRLICDIYVFKSREKYLGHFELVSLLQSLVGTVYTNVSSIASFRIRVANECEDLDKPYVVGRVREVPEDYNLDELFPSFTEDNVMLILERLTPVE